MLYKSYSAKKMLAIECFYSLFEATYKDDYLFSGESHDFWEIVYVRSGNICASADEYVFHLSEGDMIFHKPMEFHKLHVEGGDSATCFTMTFSASGSLMKQFENCVLRLSAEQQKYFAEMISFLQTECALTGNCDYVCIDEIIKYPVKFQTFVCMAELLFLSLSENNITLSADVSSAGALTYQQAVHVMEDNITIWMSVPDIAKKCNVSVSYLKEIFTKYTGLGVHQYFLKLKLAYATYMLRDGKTVTEVAMALSFSSSNYFSTVFRRETGQLPSAYKST